MAAHDWTLNEEIAIFREYLQIPSVHPNPDYGGCVLFLQKQALSLGLPFSVHHVNGDRTKPFVVITWAGSERDRKSILLNSHMDVVPVYRDSWTHDPFAAEVDTDGRIFARGSQDMKCVGTQYLAAIRELRRQGFSPKRTFHVLFVPDEEIGGNVGMRVIANSAEFRALNIGFVLDEGMASVSNYFQVFYGERAHWFVHVYFSGTTGRSELLPHGTAGEKVASFLANFSRFRVGEVQKLVDNPQLSASDVTSINLTVIKGGFSPNVLPATLQITLDIRVAVDINHVDFEQMLLNWCREAGDGVTIDYLTKAPPVEPTKVDDTNVYWSALSTAFKELNVDIEQRIFVASTDGHILREHGFPVIGFSPINNTPVLLHSNDEYLSVDTYLKGIRVYTKILAKLSDV